MIKHGADLRGIQPEMAIAYTIVAHIYWNTHGAVCTITEGTGGVHMVDSKHGEGKALDIRVHNIPTNEWNALLMDIKTALGPQFDVILEHTPPHFHVEFDPKDKPKEGTPV